MADKPELQRLPQTVAALGLSDVRSSLIARARKDAAKLAVRQPPVEPVPDLGKYLASKGHPRKTLIIFNSWEADYIDVVGDGQYRRTRVLHFAGELFCATYEFGNNILEQILTRISTRTASFINQSLKESRDGVRRLTLPDPIKVGVAVFLGSPRQGRHETYIPLIIKEVFGYDPARVMEELKAEAEVNESEPPALTKGGRYKLKTGDKAILSAAIVMLKKVAAAKTSEPDQLMSVSKLLNFISKLPEVPSGVDVSVTVSGPNRKFGDINTSDHWTVAVEGLWVSISSGGYFFRPSSGGDSFTTMTWSAAPGEIPDFRDYRDSLQIVPGLRSFSDGVEKIDLASGNYSLEINDYDNPCVKKLF
jgi:hypothetical protein